MNADPTPHQPPGDAELAADIATEAGALLLALRESWDWGKPAEPSKESSKELGLRGDRESNDLILARLAAHRPGDRVLSEESSDDLARLEAHRVWIVDPLDGTREFSMRGRADWAVHVALWEAGAEITAAAVSQPALGKTYVTGQSADQQPAQSPPVMLVSDSRPPAFAAGVAERTGLRLEQMGSAGAKAMAVVRGYAGAYLHAGGQWEWDSAAPVGVALASGLHASRLDGSPLRYNQVRPYLPDLLICRPELAEPLLTALAEAIAG